MKIVKAEGDLIDRYAGEIADLVYATGPVSYDYQFGGRSLLDAIVDWSWRQPGTLFSADATWLALEDEELLGIMISFHGPEYRDRIAALNPGWPEILASGEFSQDDVQSLIERADLASWLNPVNRPGRYYIHAVAAKPEHKGKGVGAALIAHAQQLGREMKCEALELDVLSDNPAVGFYHARGLEILVESKAPKPFAAGVPVEYRMGMAL